MGRVTGEKAKGIISAEPASTQSSLFARLGVGSRSSCTSFHSPTSQTACLAAQPSNLSNAEGSLGKMQHFRKQSHTRESLLFPGKRVYTETTANSVEGDMSPRRLCHLPEHAQYLLGAGEGTTGCKGGGGVVCTHHTPAVGRHCALPLASVAPSPDPVITSILQWGKWWQEQVACPTSQSPEGTEPALTLQNNLLFDHISCSIGLSSSVKGFLGHHGKFKETGETQPNPPSSDRQ